MTVRSFGQIAAAALLALGALLVFFAWQGSQGGTGPAIFTPPPDAGRAQPGEDPRNILLLGKGNVWERNNPDNGRLEYRLEWDTLDPQPAGRFLVDGPRARIYGDGVRVELSALRGRLVWPSQNERVPESGDLDEDVIIRVYHQHAEPGAEHEEDPLVTIATSSLRFESSIGELATDDAIAIQGSGVTFRGRGLTLRINPDERQLQFGLIDRGEELIIDPAQLESASESAARADDQPRASQNAGPAGDTAAGESLAHYQVLLRGGASLSRDALTARAEEMIIWARLRDGQIAPDAITAFAFAQNPDSPTDSPTGTDEPQTQDEATGRIRLVWDGPLEIRPVEPSAGPLARDDLAVQFDSPAQVTPVRLTDSASGSRLTAGRVLYGATTGRVEIDPLAELEVVVESPGRFRARLPGVRGDLSRRTATVAGGGEVTLGDDANADSRRRPSALIADDDADEPNEPPATITWTGQSDVLLGGTDDALTLRRIAFTDNVVASDTVRALSGDYARLDFARTSATVDGPRIDSLTVTGNAALVQAATEQQAEARAQADTMRLLFDPAAAEARPLAASASGNVQLNSEDGQLGARTVDVRFLPPDPADDALRLLDVVAEGDVAATTADGIDLAGERMLADARRETLQVIGQQASITIDDDQGIRRVTGPNIVLTQPTRQFIVYGGGEAYAKLDHTDPQDQPQAHTEPDPGATEPMASDGDPPDAGQDPIDDPDDPFAVFDRRAREQAAAQAEQHVEVPDQPDPVVFEEVTLRWTDSLFVDDLAGVAEAVGRAHALGVQGQADRHEARGERVIVRYTPYADPQADDTLTTPRELLGFTIEAAPNHAPGEPEPFARIESRFFGQAMADPELGEPTVIALQGDELIGDADEQTLTVPAAGFLLFSDQRPDGTDQQPERPQPENTASLEGFEASRGTSLFRWNTSLVVDRPAGTITMLGEVRVNHLARDSTDLTVIESAELVARFQRPPPQQQELRQLREVPALQRIEATGGVYLKHQQLEVTADRLEFIEAQSLAIVTAATGNQVSIHDGAKQEHYAAEAIEIDLRTGNWRAIGASGRRIVR